MFIYINIICVYVSVCMCVLMYAAMYVSGYSLAIMYIYMCVCVRTYVCMLWRVKYRSTQNHCVQYKSQQFDNHHKSYLKSLAIVCLCPYIGLFLTQPSVPHSRHTACLCRPLASDILHRLFRAIRTTPKCFHSRLAEANPLNKCIWKCIISSYSIYLLYYFSGYSKPLVTIIKIGLCV